MIGYQNLIKKKKENQINPFLFSLEEVHTVINVGHRNVNT